MTGREFALAVLIGLIANAIYDALRNPPPPVFKDDQRHSKRISKFIDSIKWNLLRLKSSINTAGQVCLDVLRKEEARLLAVKKEDSQRLMLQGSYAKMTRIRAINDVDILVVCPSSYPNTPPQAFLKKCK